jgi:ribosome biogenesis protein YTM1
MDIDDNILTSAATASSMAVFGSSNGGGASSGNAAAAAASAAAAAALTELSEVSVRFVTRNPSLPQVPNTFLSVPVRLARYGLSEVVNALTQADPPRPFDFLIAGKFLRGTLLAHLTRTGQAGESGLEIEYVEALPEPSSAPSRPHPDWIAAIDARPPGAQHALTACYDSVVRMYDVKDVAAPPIATGVGHSSAVKSVAAFKLLPGAGAGAGAAAAAAGYRLVTGSKDRTVRVWQYNPGSAALRCVGVCSGHTDSVESVATAPGAAVFASGGWDNKVLLWDTSDETKAVKNEEDDEQPAPATKKARKSAAAAAVAPTIPAFAPLQSLEGHTGAVTALVYPHPAALYSGGMDHTLRQWDVSTGVVSQAWFGTKVITSLDFSPLANVMATAHNDGVIRIWDPRAGKAASSSGAGPKDAVVASLKSHRGWASSVRFNPEHGQQLASGSYDHSVKLWDLRASLPLFTLKDAHKDKVLALDWNDADTLLSGGADKQIQEHATGAKAAAHRSSASASSNGKQEDTSMEPAAAAAATKKAGKGKSKK